MQKYKVYNLIFSSSATVYGQDHPYLGLKTLNWNFLKALSNQSIYRKFITKILSIRYEFSAGILRYFNPIGCHSSGLIGDRIDGSTNLIPSIMLYLLGKKPYLPIYGNDYKTKDGSV